MNALYILFIYRCFLENFIKDRILLRLISLFFSVEKAWVYLNDLAENFAASSHIHWFSASLVVSSSFAASPHWFCASPSMFWFRQGIVLFKALNDTVENYADWSSSLLLRLNPLMGSSFALSTNCDLQTIAIPGCSYFTGYFAAQLSPAVTVKVPLSNLEPHDL